MATLTSLRTDIEGLATTAMDASLVVWSKAPNDLTLDHTIKDRNATLQSVVSFVRVNAEVDGNTLYSVAESTLRINYKAASRRTAPPAVTYVPIDDDVYDWIGLSWQALGAILLPPSAWRALPSVYEVIGGPEAGPHEQVLDVITTEIVTQVLLTP